MSADGGQTPITLKCTAQRRAQHAEIWRNNSGVYAPDVLGVAPGCLSAACIPLNAARHRIIHPLRLFSASPSSRSHDG